MNLFMRKGKEQSVRYPHKLYGKKVSKKKKTFRNMEKLSRILLHYAQN